MQEIDVKIMLCLISIIVTLFLMYHLQQLVNYRQLKSKRLPMNARTFIKTFCSCSDTRNWYVHRTSTPSLSLWHTWIYFSYDIACSIDIGIRMPFLLLYNPRLILFPVKVCATSFP